MKKIKNLAVIQARMGSTRLPGKVMFKLGNLTILEWVVRAVRKIKDISNIIIVTTNLNEDNVIEEFSRKKKINFFRGDKDDVLKRIFKATEKEKPENIIRITADCPFLDPSVCEQVLFLHSQTNADYTSNTIPLTWPDGLDCEIFKFAALKKANLNAKLPSEREHVTKWIKANQNIFNIQSLICPFKNSYKYRWTIDYLEDFKMMKKIVQKFSDKNLIPYLELIKFLEKKPKIFNINKNVKKNDVEKKNIANDIKSKNFYKKTFNNSTKLFNSSKKVIPLGGQTFSKSFINWPLKKSPLFLTHGYGGKVWDVDGNEYVDLVCGLLPIILGYCDQDVDYAIRQQMNKGITFSLSNSLEEKLAKKLKQHIPSAEQVRFAKNGTDVTSAAIRLARYVTKKDRIIVCGYHGWQDWFIGSTSMNNGVPNNVKELTSTIKYNSIEDLDKIFKSYPDQIAAVIMEPTNYEKPKKSFLIEAKKIIHKNKALLIFDEICTGFRVSLGGAQSYFNITPDLSCFGKSMGNGMPIAALVGKKNIMNKMDQIFFSGTFGGETLSLAASLAVIEKIEDKNVINFLWKYGTNLKNEVNKLIKKNKLEKVIELKGLSPWILLTFNNYEKYNKFQIITYFKRLMIENGVLVSLSHNICYAHNDNNFNVILNAYRNTLFSLSKLLKNKKLLKELKNLRVVSPIFQIRQESNKKI